MNIKERVSWAIAKSKKIRSTVFLIASSPKEVTELASALSAQASNWADAKPYNLCAVVEYWGCSRGTELSRTWTIHLHIPPFKKVESPKPFNITAEELEATRSWHGAESFESESEVVSQCAYDRVKGALEGLEVVLSRMDSENIGAYQLLAERLQGLCSEFRRVS